MKIRRSFSNKHEYLEDIMENRITPRDQNAQDSMPPPLEQADFDREDGLESASDAPISKESDLQLDDSGGDIGFDRVVRGNEAGLGGGLDQAEEAQLGVTDEELEKMIEDRKQSPRSRPDQ